MLACKVLVAENGSAAVAVIDKRDNTDLVFSDVVMAGAMPGSISPPSGSESSGHRSRCG
jgi:hypothetical protein